MPKQVTAEHYRAAGRDDARAARGIAVQQIVPADGLKAAA